MKWGENKGNSVKEKMSALAKRIFRCRKNRAYHTVILPALNQGMLVICDRYIDSFSLIKASQGGWD